MRTEYKRDMNHNYLILTGEERIDTDSYQVRMIVANAVPDLLQCRIQGIDGKFMVYYDITSRHSMTALFEEKKMDLESLQVILGGFIQIMEEMSEYLLNPCQLILEPEYIYLDAEKKKVSDFVIFRDFMGKYRNSFRVLRSISFQSWIMKTEKRSCWDIMYTDVHWRTAFIWNTSRKSYIKYVTATRKIFLHMKKRKQWFRKKTG